MSTNMLTLIGNMNAERFLGSGLPHLSLMGLTATPVCSFSMWIMWWSEITTLTNLLFIMAAVVKNLILSMKALKAPHQFHFNKPATCKLWRQQFLTYILLKLNKEATVQVWATFAATHLSWSLIGTSVPMLIIAHWEHLNFVWEKSWYMCKQSSLDQCQCWFLQRG